MASDIQVYGSDWCGITYSVRKYLRNSRMEYEFYDIDVDPSAENFVLATHDGRRHSPVVVVLDEVLTSPTITELRRVLEAQGFDPLRRGL
jgi:mycoredoxin